ncbi:hypothetical protein [Mongoliimonas terrestris]|uniref:hypothetical protein n=1 Tax=Mongoliimonas terrestris TaxID=1709001 RepID=UPI000AEF3BB2|nr:hypothetical protein [Mongoliimonas terrestris]
MSHEKGSWWMRGLTVGVCLAIGGLSAISVLRAGGTLPLVRAAEDPQALPTEALSALLTAVPETCDGAAFPARRTIHGALADRTDAPDAVTDAARRTAALAVACSPADGRALAWHARLLAGEAAIRAALLSQKTAPADPAALRDRVAVWSRTGGDLPPEAFEAFESDLTVVLSTWAEPDVRAVTQALSPAHRSVLAERMAALPAERRDLLNQFGI